MGLIEEALCLEGSGPRFAVLHADNNDNARARNSNFFIERISAERPRAVKKLAGTNASVQDISEWQSSADSFGKGDLLQLGKVASEAHSGSSLKQSKRRFS